MIIVAICVIGVGVLAALSVIASAKIDGKYGEKG